jgi:hypothetical protein
LWKDTQRQPSLVGAADDPRTILLREKVEMKLKIMAPGESAFWSRPEALLARCAPRVHFRTCAARPFLEMPQAKISRSSLIIA